MSSLGLSEGGGGSGGLVEECAVLRRGWWGYRVINQIPKKCASKSSRIPARLYLKHTPPPPHHQSHWELGFRGALEHHLSLNSQESRRVQTAEQSAIKREVNMFYLPNGIAHNIYVCLVIHGGVS